jgi:hypothetical protein
MNYLRVRNWDKHQHYKDRFIPSWIKIYTSLIDGDDFEYASLSDASKIQLIHLWLLAAKHKNLIPYRPDWIQSRLNLKGKVNLEALIAAGFLEICDENGTSRQVSEIPENVSRGGLEKIRGEEIREEKIEIKKEPASFDADACFEEIWQRYPRKIGKALAKEHFRKSVKTPADLSEISAALDHYLDEVRGWEERYIKHGDAWFHKWQKWIPEEPVMVPRSAGVDDEEQRQARLGDYECFVPVVDAWLSANGPPETTADRTRMWNEIRVDYGYFEKLQQEFGGGA